MASPLPNLGLAVSCKCRASLQTSTAVTSWIEHSGIVCSKNTQRAWLSVFQSAEDFYSLPFRTPRQWLPFEKVLVICTQAAIAYVFRPPCIFLKMASGRFFNQPPSSNDTPL